MKIVFLVDFLPTRESGGGGLQNYVARIAQALHEAGEEVTVICSRSQENYSGLFGFAVRQSKLSYSEKKLLSYLQAVTFHKLDNSLRHLLDAWAIRRECCKEKDIEIIQSPNYQFMGLFVKAGTAKLIVRASSYRNLWSSSDGVKNTLDVRFINYCEDRLFKRADYVIAPSAHLANILENKGLHVDIIQTPISAVIPIQDENWYHQHLSQRRYILYFGTMLKRKGIYVLAEAMKLVWEKNPEVLLVMVGPDLSVNGKSRIREFFDLIGSNKDRVIYSTQLKHELLYPVITHSSFVVLPSIEDNCPNTMLEAMALGKAVLGTIGSSMDEFYPEQCSTLLVPHSNIQLLADKILDLWNLPQEKLDELGSEFKLFVEENHSFERVATILRDYYVRKTANS